MRNRMKNANKPNTRACTWDGIPQARAKVTGKGKGISWGKGKTGGTQSVNEAFNGRCYWCNGADHRASECRKKTAYLKCKGQGSTPEDEAQMRTLDVCILENITKALAR